MKATRRMATFVLALCCVVGLVIPVSAQEKDIVDTAVGAGSLNTLVTAIKAAGLVDTLKGPGPFTLFAPTDDAFAKLTKEAVDDLLKPENKAKLTAILTYHVVPGKIMASELVVGKTFKTLEGSVIKVGPTPKRDKVKIGRANVVKTNVMATNGVIHVIDAVMTPPIKRGSTETE